jgi:hypothetical protein
LEGEEGENSLTLYIFNLLFFWEDIEQKKLKNCFKEEEISKSISFDLLFLFVGEF